MINFSCPLLFPCSSINVAGLCGAGDCRPLVSFTCETVGNNCECVQQDCGDSSPECMGACPGEDVCVSALDGCGCVPPL